MKRREHCRNFAMGLGGEIVREGDECSLRSTKEKTPRSDGFWKEISVGQVMQCHLSWSG